MKIAWVVPCLLVIGLAGCSKKPKPVTELDFPVPTAEYVTATTPTGVPRTLYINGQIWSLEKIKHYPGTEKHRPGDLFAGTTAQTNCEKRTITYIATEDPFALRINLMHEIFHAGDCLHGGDTWWNSEHPTAADHPGVYNLGEFTAIFIKMNPIFMRWMAE